MSNFEFGYSDVRPAGSPPALYGPGARLSPAGARLAQAVAGVSREHGGLPWGEGDPDSVDALMADLMGDVPAYGQ
jgi:hypothetical protein